MSMMDELAEGVRSALGNRELRSPAEVMAALADAAEIMAATGELYDCLGSALLPMTGVRPEYSAAVLEAAADLNWEANRLRSVVDGPLAPGWVKKTIFGNRTEPEPLATADRRYQELQPEPGWAKRTIFRR